jgi:hypothetical protein
LRRECGFSTSGPIDQAGCCEIWEKGSDYKKNAEKLLNSSASLRLSMN